MVRHEPATLSCPTCGTLIKRKKDLGRHMKMHQETLVCPTCAKVVSRKSDLVRHLKMHDESWVCDGATEGPCGDSGCGRVFTRKDSMVRHWARLQKAREKSSEYVEG